MNVSYKVESIKPFYVGNVFSSIASDNSTFASAVNDKVMISDLHTGEITKELPGDGEDITCLQLTNDGKYLAICSASQVATIYNLDEDKIVHSFKLSAPVYSLSNDLTNTLFAFGSTDGLIQVWDIDNGYITHSLKGHSSIISSLKFCSELNTNKWYLISGDVSGAVKVWDLVSRKAIVTLSEHNSPVRGIDISSDFKYMVTGGRDNILNIFEISSNENNKKLKFKLLNTVPTKQQIEACGFINQIGEEIKNVNYIYFGGDGNYLQIYDFLHNKLVIGTTKKPIETVEELTISQIIKTTNDSLVLILSDQTIQLVELSKAQLLPVDHTYNLSFSKVYAGNNGIIADMRFVGPNLDLLALATNSPGLRILSPLGNKMELINLEGHTDFLNALDVSEDGRWIVTSSKDNDARLWRYNDELITFDNVAVFKGHMGAVTSICMSRVYNEKQPNFIITGSKDLTVKRWDIPHLENQNELPLVINTSKYTRKAHEKDINSVDLSPNDEFFGSASYDKTAKIWDCQTGEVVAILKGHKRGLWKLQFCPFDKLVLTCSGDKTLKLWSLTNFQCLRTFEGHSNSVLDCKFIDRKRIIKQNELEEDEINLKAKNNINQVISSGADGLLKIWNLYNGELIKTLDDHEDKIWCLCSKNSGEFIVSADNDGLMNLWEDNSLEMLKEEQLRAKVEVEQQQSLENYIRLREWEKAFKLALKLNHPLKLYHVLKSCIEEPSEKSSFLGSEKLDECVSNLDNEELIIVLERLKSWNTNFKYFEIAQKLLRCILNYHSAKKLMEIPKLVRTIDSIIPYNTRHYARLDNLIENSYVLDYAIQEMNKMIM